MSLAQWHVYQGDVVQLGSLLFFQSLVNIPMEGWKILLHSPWWLLQKVKNPLGTVCNVQLNEAVILPPKCHCTFELFRCPVRSFCPSIFLYEGSEGGGGGLKERTGEAKEERTVRKVKFEEKKNLSLKLKSVGACLQSCPLFWSRKQTRVGNSHKARDWKLEKIPPPSLNGQ